MPYTSAPWPSARPAWAPVLPPIGRVKRVSNDWCFSADNGSATLASDLIRTNCPRGRRLMSRSRWRLFSTVVATIALTVTAMVAGPAIAAVPGPPNSVTARAGDQLAEVTWNAPTPDDPTITGYVVTASPANTPAVTVDDTARTATVTGLTNGTAYTFTVAATNPDGTSPPSEPSAPATPGPPTPARRSR